MNGSDFSEIENSNVSEQHSDVYAENAGLEEVFMRLQNETDEDERRKLFVWFLIMMTEAVVHDATVPVPFIDVNNALFESIDPERVKAGDTIELNEDVRLRMDTMTDAAGDEWVPLFLNEEAIAKGQTGNIIIPVSLEDVLRFGYEWESVKGVVIDPFGSPFVMTKDLLHKILSREMIQVETE